MRKLAALAVTAAMLAPAAAQAVRPHASRATRCVPTKTFKAYPRMKVRKSTYIAHPRMK